MQTQWRFRFQNAFSLAQALWESIDAGVAEADERLAVAEAIRRDKELSSGRVAGRTHEEVMEAARRALDCDTSGREVSTTTR